MKREQFEHRMGTEPGIGVEYETADGRTVYGFYPDTPKRRGICRAMKELYPRRQRGEIVRLTFIERTPSPR